MAKITKKTAVKKTKKKNAADVTDHGRVYITSTFNNTLVTVTNDKGDTLGWSSSGAKGFKGTRKSTPYAASMAVEDIVKQIVAKGLKTVDVFVKGPGAGRDSSLRGIKSAGASILSIADITPMPHNGPRPKNRRRV
ncbi:MAG: 30S ribosomal protein S11 [Patescibacteria group bacterium]